MCSKCLNMTSHRLKQQSLLGLSTSSNYWKEDIYQLYWLENTINTLMVANGVYFVLFLLQHQWLQISYTKHHKEHVGFHVLTKNILTLWEPNLQPSNRKLIYCRCIILLTNDCICYTVTPRRHSHDKSCSNTWPIFLEILWYYNFHVLISLNISSESFWLFEWVPYVEDLPKGFNNSQDPQSNAFKQKEAFLSEHKEYFKRITVSFPKQMCKKVVITAQLWSGKRAGPIHVQNNGRQCW